MIEVNDNKKERSTKMYWVGKSAVEKQHTSSTSLQ